MPAYSYEYKINGIIKAPAQDVGKLFERLERSKAGLTPSSVLNASREEGTLLHSSFEWDDAKAGEKYRLQQARFIIQNIVVIEQTDTGSERENKPDRAYVITPGRKGNYVALENALTKDEWRQHLLKEARDDMDFFTAKYRRLSELADVIQSMDKAKQDM